MSLLLEKLGKELQKELACDMAIILRGIFSPIRGTGYVGYTPYFVGGLL